jgi:hypothetical protein
MKTLKDMLLEASNTEGFFMGKTSIRVNDDFKFNAGEDAILIKYTTDGYEAQLRNLVKIDKVSRNSIKIKSSSGNDEFYSSKKFDKYGICVEKNKNKYRGNSTIYWVLYNKELANDTDINELISNGSCSWGFKIKHNPAENIKELKQYISEITK